LINNGYVVKPINIRLSSSAENHRDDCVACDQQQHDTLQADFTLDEKLCTIYIYIYIYSIYIYSHTHI